MYANVHMESNVIVRRRSMIVSNSRDLGLLIRRRRQELGLTQVEVARLSGVSRQWLIQVEQGKGTAEVDRVIRLLRVLRLRTDVAPVSEPSDG